MRSWPSSNNRRNMSEQKPLQHPVLHSHTTEEHEHTHSHGHGHHHHSHGHDHHHHDHHDHHHGDHDHHDHHDHDHGHEHDHSNHRYVNRVAPFLSSHKVMADMGTPMRKWTTLVALLNVKLPSPQQETGRNDLSQLVSSQVIPHL